MCLGGGGAPAPDPYATAAAQNSVNSAALNQAAQLNQINQQGPFGSLTYSGAIGSPDRTQTVSLTPELQNLLTGQTNLSQGLTDLANTRLAGAPTEAFSLDGATPVRQAQGVNYATSFNQGPAVQTGFDQGPALQQTITSGGQIADSFDAGGTAQRGVNLSGVPQLRSDFENMGQEATDAAYRRNTRYMDPQFQQQEQDIRSRLAAQGITAGSDAYNREIQNFENSRQQAYDAARDSAVGQGYDLQNQLFGQSLAGRQQGVGEQFDLGNFSNSALAQQFGMNQAQAQFGNQAQAQRFGQNAAQAQFANDAAQQQFLRNQAMANFANQAAGQIYGQNMGAAQFGNDALARQFASGLDLQQADQSLRSQGINENILGRNQNINEAMAYVNGAPVAPQQPTFQPFATSTAAQGSPDMVGLAGSNYANQSAMRGNILGPIFGGLGQVGGAAIGACWVAREVYGEENPKWKEFRSWMLWNTPKWFRKLYMTYGERFAQWISDKPIVKAVVRSMMDGCLHGTA